MLFYEGGHYGRRGHYRGSSKRIKASVHHQESAGEGDHAERGLRGSIPEFAADPKDREASKTGRGHGRDSQIERSAFESADSGSSQGQGDRTVSVAVLGFWSDAGIGEASGKGPDSSQRRDVTALADGVRRLEEEAQKEGTSSMERTKSSSRRDGTNGWFTSRLV